MALSERERAVCRNCFRACFADLPQGGLKKKYENIRKLTAQGVCPSGGTHAVTATDRTDTDVNIPDCF